MEIHDHGDKVEEETKSGGRDGYIGNRGGEAVKTEANVSNEGKRKSMRDFSFCNSRQNCHRPGTVCF